MKNKELIYYILEDSGINTEWLEEEGTVFFENSDFHTAIVGITSDGKVVYDYEKMVEHLSLEDNISYEEASEYIDYNTLRAMPYMGEMAPVVIYPVHQEIDEYQYKLVKSMKEITNTCESCPSRECCPEDECVLFRIEKIIE